MIVSRAGCYRYPRCSAMLPAQRWLMRQASSAGQICKAMPDQIYIAPAHCRRAHVAQSAEGPTWRIAHATQCCSSLHEGMHLRHASQALPCCPGCWQSCAPWIVRVPLTLSILLCLPIKASPHLGGWCGSPQPACNSGTNGMDACLQVKRKALIKTAELEEDALITEYLRQRDLREQVHIGVA